MKKTISVIGCGWLGLPLAKQLAGEGYRVNGSTTSEAKLETLKEAGIQPFLIDLRNPDSLESLPQFLQSEILFINVPPGRKQTNHEPYLEQMKHLLHQASQSNVKKVIFISSTSVYASSNQEVTEDTPLQPETGSGTILKSTEELLRDDQNFQVTILRMAGLVGPDRHPGRFLAGKRELNNAEGSVNLIHLTDCIGIVKTILDKDIWDDTFNCCSDEHPTRKAFYTHAASEQGLPEPHFLESSETRYKTVMNAKVKEVLGYEFEYDSPFRMV